MKNLSLRKLLLIAATAFSAVLLCNVFSFGQSIETIKTKAGNLTLESSEDRVLQVKIRNKVFLTQPGLGTIEGKYPRVNPDWILLSVGEGALACAGYFYIVDVSKNKPTITDAFGNCNTAPKIIYKNETLTVKFPDGSNIPTEDSGAHRYGAAATWTYRNGKLLKLK